MSINFEIYSFIDKIAPYQEEVPNIKGRTEKMYGDGKQPIIHLEDVKDFAISSFNPVDNKVISKYKYINGKLFGLNEENFKDFKDFLTKVCRLKEFKEKCDFDFIIDKSFDYLIDIYKTSVSRVDFLKYLMLKIDEET